MQVRGFTVYSCYNYPLESGKVLARVLRVLLQHFPEETEKEQKFLLRTA
jgi:hypothetical protein